MGCMNTKPNYKYDFSLDEEQDRIYYMNIFKNSSDEYSFTGVLSPDVKSFHLIFMKEDEERLPLAISFDLSDDGFHGSQYQFLQLSLTKSKEDLENVVIQYPDDELSNVFSCLLSPSFPYAVDISGTIKLK